MLSDIIIFNGNRSHKNEDHRIAGNIGEKKIWRFSS